MFSIPILKGHSNYAPAEYTYPFDWDLPAELPISFEAKFGYIRYKVVAGLDRPLRPDKCYTEMFTMLKRADLNEIPDLNVWQLLMMITDARSIHINCFFFSIFD